MSNVCYVSPSFWRYHLTYPLLFLLVATVVIQVLEIDRQLAMWLYGLEGHEWSLRRYWLTSEILHKDGRYLSVGLLIVMLFLVIGSLRMTRLQPYKRPFLFALTAAIASSFVIGGLKPLLATSCPWDFDIFGGHIPYLPLWQQLWVRNGEGCFPAGHASAAYAWICLYFIGVYYRAPWRWWALTGVLLIGLVFGGAQQLRGAHFISHDLWTLAICWLTSLLLFTYFLKPQPMADKA